MATVIKGSSKRGQGLVLSTLHKVGFRLEDVYGSFSTSKQAGWDYCFQKYLETPERDNFRITGYNTSMFTVAWNGLFGGEPALFVETHRNSYVVLLNK